MRQIDNYQKELEILAELHRPEAHIWGDRRGATQPECHRKWVGIMIHVFKLDLLSTTASWPGMRTEEREKPLKPVAGGVLQAP